MMLWRTAILAGLAIGLCLPVPSFAQEAEKIPLTFFGANRGAPASMEKAPASAFFGASAGTYLKGYFKEVYPAIDMACYSDELSTEYVFIVHPGGDPSLIRFSCGGGFKAEQRPDTTAVTLQSSRRELTFSQPVAVLHQENKERSVLCRFGMITPSEFEVDASAGMVLMSENLNGTLFNKIPKGGQPLGPDYDFYLARLEISTEQYLNFLNDAEANSMNSKGANLVFDKLGNVWIHADRQPGRDEAFTISQSRLEYLPGKTAGWRYQLRGGKQGARYASHPITGISWYGAIKYCNWLTLIANRGASEQCFKEGTNHLSWAPVAVTNWTQGTFSNEERAAWIKMKGFRMPMVGTNSLVLEASRYNEMYKAAVWNGHTNLAYGYGRDTFDGNDANFLDMSNTIADTLPTGFFAPTNVLVNENFQPSQNAYGIFDLSGNVSEWTSDTYGKDMVKGMLTFGGSWADKHTPANQCRVMPPHATQSSGGFRPLTTFMPSYTMEIHFLVTFFELPEMPIIPPTPPFIQDGAQAEPAEPESPPSLLVPTEGPPVNALAPPYEANRDNPIGLTILPPEGVSPPIAPPSDGGGGGRRVPPGPFIPPGPPGPGPAPRTNFYLTVNSIPFNAVPITCTPDVVGNGNGNTVFVRNYAATNATVTLTAPPTTGPASFVRWQMDGVDFSTNQSVTFTMTSDLTMTAVYLMPYVRLRVFSSPANGVPITCTQDAFTNSNGNTAFTRYYVLNTPVTVSAPPMAGINTFSRWELDGLLITTNYTANFNMNTNHDAVAIYVFIPGPIDPPDPSPSGL